MEKLVNSIEKINSDIEDQPKNRLAYISELAEELRANIDNDPKFQNLSQRLTSTRICSNGRCEDRFVYIARESAKVTAQYIKKLKLN